MAMINAGSLDLTLSSIKNANVLVLCSLEEPINITEVMTNKLASSVISITGVPEYSETGLGRRLLIPSVSGTVEVSGLAKSWALINTNSGTLYAVGYLRNQQQLYEDNEFSLNEFYVRIGYV
jgi:hypothetical protein